MSGAGLVEVSGRPLRVERYTPERRAAPLPAWWDTWREQLRVGQAPVGLGRALAAEAAQHAGFQVQGGAGR